MIDLKDYRRALGNFPTGVTIVTTSDGTAWQAALNVIPLLASAATPLECSVHARIDAGYQEILLSLMESYTHHSTAPLVYCRSSFSAAPQMEVTI